jgi:hypothetical protein
MAFRIGEEAMPTKLNIGCGFDKRADYLNIDVHPECEPDILVQDNDLSQLPDGYFEEIRAWDVLEHIPHASTVTALLDWSALLKIGGKLVLQTSSIYGVVDEMRKSPSFETEYNWTKCLFGNQAHPGDFHYCGFTESTLRVFLRAAGFDARSFTLADGWLLGCVTTKVESWTDLLNLSDEEMMRSAYRRFLRREITPQTLSDYLRIMQTGGSRRSLVRELAAAPEHLYKLGKELDSVQ